MTDNAELATELEPERIAVVGMACRVPGADDVTGFWQNLVDGVESIQRHAIPEDAPPGYVPAVAALDGVEDFDAALFGMTPREAELADPQHRLFIEQCWAALEHAGCDPLRVDGRVGVWGGVSFNSYLPLHVLPGLRREELLGEYPASLLHGNDKDYLTSRVANRLGLTGPAISVQTACSTSLVAVVQACQSLLDYGCDVALAGGAAVRLPQGWGYVYETGGIQSPDGHCRAFDAEASGTVFGSGVGVVVLKRLSDAIEQGDTIHAVVLGGAVNNDGARKVGYAAPSVDGQIEVLYDAYHLADVSPASIGYVEAHGTGTAIGDPIELAALDEVFAAAGAQPGTVGIGSVKSNVGHLNAASGVIGLIKAALAVREGVIPESLHYRRRNPRTDEKSPFAVNNRLRQWHGEEGPRRAGVSSFGVGGTNAHIVVEQADMRPMTQRGTRPEQLLVVSANTPAALRASVARMADAVASCSPDTLPDLARTLQRGRRHFTHRVAVAVGDDPARAAADLRAAGEEQAVDGIGVAFLFPGQGAQYQGMTGGLLETEPEYARHIDECARLLAPHGIDLRALLVGRIVPGETDPLVATELAQPALFSVEYALGRWWQAHGVRPTAMLGHSIGEWVAACLAGVFSLPDALALVVERGRLMAALPRGAMLAVELTEDQARELLAGGLSLAAVNAPGRCVLSGPEPAIARVETELGHRDIGARRLATSHAFHSAMLDPMVEPFEELVARTRPRSPAIPFVSDVTGAWITDQQASDPHYWATQARATVRFGDGLATILSDGAPALLEVGPGRALGRFATRVGEPGVRIAASMPRARPSTSDGHVLLTALGRMWAYGADVSWAEFDAAEDRRTIPLPGYPFERRRHWIDAPGTPSVAAGESTEAKPPADSALVPPIGEDTAVGWILAVWRDLLGIDDISPDDHLFALGGDSLTATKIVSRVNRRFAVDLPLEEFLDNPTTRCLADLVAAIAEPGKEVEH